MLPSSSRTVSLICCMHVVTSLSGSRVNLLHMRIARAHIRVFFTHYAQDYAYASIMCACLNVVRWDYVLALPTFKVQQVTESWGVTWGPGYYVSTFKWDFTCENAGVLHCSILHCSIYFCLSGGDTGCKSHSKELHITTKGPWPSHPFCQRRIHQLSLLAR